MDYDEGGRRWRDNGGVEIELIVASTYCANYMRNTKMGLQKIFYT